MAYFDPVSNKQSFPEMEESILKFWNENKIFEKSIENRNGAEEFVFYDGPPFATGLPHYGHIITSVIKDMVPRYKTMRGLKVDRRWGWDCHGLPIENVVEKKLEITSREGIEEHGVSEFCEDCRENVFTYADEWETVINRMGRWVDFDNQYRTMDTNYMESVWWVFKELYDKGLIYEGHKVLPYCFHCHTPLSTFETRMDDSYRMRQDKTVTAKLKVDGTDDEFFLIWTTTPWTLPSNLSIAVGEKIDYVKVKDANGEIYILAKALLGSYYKNEEDYEIVGEMKGADLLGLKYEPLFDYFEKSSQAEGQESKDRFKVVGADFVTTEDGTGIVHLAPAFGEDDFYICKENNVVFFLPVDEDGKFTSDVPDLEGKNVFDANDEVIAKLKESGKLILLKSYEHSYPHCWRCDTPLIYKAITAWFVAVEPIKAKMIENNKTINWVPEHVRDGAMGKWLEGARDWCISRNRYWGSVLPVWKCDSCENLKVMGSKKDLEDLTGEPVEDLHKHFVDKHEFACDKCEGNMKRIPEVLDCWFESGSMPYAQVHYPFENKEWFESHFPADFIVEYIGQTRGWFYTMLVLSAALFEKPAFKNVVVHGVILAEDGRKMSKRLKNYPDPMDLVNKYGVDSLRLALMLSPNVKGDDIRFSEAMVDTAVKKVILAFWNAYSFFVTYSNIDGWEPKDMDLDSTNELDMWILSELNMLIKDVTEKMDVYNLQRSTEAFVEFLDNLNNWYIRRSRRRFWKSQNDDDKNFAYSTLYHVLKVLSQLMAPVIPFTADAIYKNLTKEESVHLTQWPALDEAVIDSALLQKTKTVRDIVRLAFSIRAKNRMKVRQPLAMMKLVLGDAVDFELLNSDMDVIKEEINVKEIQIVEDYNEFADLDVVVNAKVLGPKFGGRVQEFIRAAKAGEFVVKDEGVEVCGELLTEEEISFVYKGREVDNVEANKELVVMLDLELSEDLRMEGVARDIVRLIQDHRKSMDYQVDAKINVTLDVKDQFMIDSIDKFNEMIMSETLSDGLNVDSEGEFHIIDLGDHAVGIASDVV